MVSVFTENPKELWFFELSRPIDQYILYYTFKCISLIKKLRRANNNA